MTVYFYNANSFKTAGMDVYEDEEHYSFKDFSNQKLDDDVLIRLMTFPNVILASHQGFLASEALSNIAKTTLTSLTQFDKNIPLGYKLKELL